MVDILKRVQKIHQRSLQRVGGELVTYTAGGSSIQQLPVVRGQTRFTNSIGDGEVATESRTVDFLVDPDHLVIGGSKVEPVIGAMITDEDGREYEVLDAGNGMGWAPADGREARMRIHTNRVDQ